MIWRKIESISVLGLSLILILALLIFGYLQFLDGSWPVPIVTYETEFIRTDQWIYSPGDVVKGRISAYKSRNLVGEVQWSLMNGRIVFFVPRVLPMPTGVIDQVCPIERLPKDLPAGDYHLEGIVTYRVNSFRTVYYKLRTNDFHVLVRGVSH